MIMFIYGGSSSGKSAYAEKCLSEIPADKKYYLATMDAHDSESLKRIAKHKKAREGKGFITIECPTDIPKALEKVDEKASVAVLIECMSNLVANEMFGKNKLFDSKDCAKKIIKDIELFSKKISHLIIVSNNIFEDGIDYDEGTKEYLKALSAVNKEITKMADKNTEVVVGIPVDMGK
ncbi:MAG: bifunctional adenosylcobinamide kinase/adenosylcobinamide-phosphate guanylyltransferase [Butyrivibrio sp.]|nr:bifunctional adenosylcobinamide kinase/adenosylcobinamide-phosphate guanylyltransferase [Butyrivibrio sp.]